MTLALGTRLGSYEIVSPLGAGGMGEVYRAKDTKLNRDVAIKVLPESFALDADRVARFTREAQVLASLNHPNIAAIYGIEEQGNTRALVMELVEGRDLSEIIAGGPEGPPLQQPGSRGPSGPRMDLAEVLPIAKQIADALEAAHEQGIVHRDLKPQNIKVRADGTVKVLDFGLAKAMDPAANVTSSVANSPTMTTPAMTGLGMILGTAGYMSPEQAKGRAVDKRADIWAFGVVLYEMVTGGSLFGAETVTESIAAVLTREPDWSKVPAPVRPLIQACLQRDPRKRLRDLGDMSLLQVDQAAPSTAAGRRAVWPWALAALAVGVAATWLVTSASRVTSVAAPMAFQEPAPKGLFMLAPPVASPDGQHIAIVVRSADGRRQIWTRALSDAESKPVEGTDGAAVVFWSPDSAEIGFAVDGEVRRVPRAGGRPAHIISAPAQFAVWTPAGDVVLAGGATLIRVPVAGGAERTLLTDRSASYRDLTLLPSGRHMLFRQFGGETGLYLMDLRDDTVRKVEFDVNALTGGVGFVSPDVVVYRRQLGSLVGRRLDVASATMVGEEIPIAENVVRFDASGTAVSFVTGRTTARLTWKDRSGRSLGTVGPEASYAQVSLSRSGRQLLFVAADEATGNQDLWIQDLIAPAANRLTSDPGTDHNAVFSPNDREVIWEGHRGQDLSVFRRPTDGSGEAHLIRAWNRGGGPDDWSPDGAFVLYGSTESKTRGDLWVLPLGDQREPFPLIATEFNESGGKISPDGRWLAYVSDATGREEIYLQQLRGTERVGGPLRVSSDGGTTPTWRRDGGELFYVSNRKLMAVKTTLGADRPVGLAQALFELDPAYAPTPDGQRFIVIDRNTATDESATVLMHWQPRIKK